MMRLQETRSTFTFLFLFILLGCISTVTSKEYSQMDSDNVDPPTKCESCIIFSKEMNSKIEKLNKAIVSFYFTLSN